MQAARDPTGETVGQLVAAQAWTHIRPFGNMGPKVRAGAKGVACPRQDRHAQLRVVAKVGPDLAQAMVDIEIDGVFHFRAIERDVGYLASLFVEHFLGHDISPFFHSHFLRRRGRPALLGSGKYLGRCRAMKSVEWFAFVGLLQLPPNRARVGRPAVDANARSGNKRRRRREQKDYRPCDFRFAAEALKRYFSRDLMLDVAAMYGVIGIQSAR